MISRRDWLKTAAWGFCAAAALPAFAEDRLRYSRPRATSGDDVDEPDWQERLTITVGGDGAEIGGFTEKTIQAAVDLVAGRGGGAVRLTPGTFTLRNCVRLRAGVRLFGAGPDTILFKAPMLESALSEDSDWYDREVTLADPAGWQVGDGICLVTKNPDTGGRDVVKRTLVARSGARFKLDKALRENFWKGQAPTASSLFPLLTAEETAGLVVEDLALDGNRANNGNLDGNYAGGIWLQDCADIVFRRITARNYNGDGISWQICHDVLVEDCHSHDNAGLGLHPGSGSQRPIIRNCRLERNGIGLFFCWGVKTGLAEKNVIADNSEYGVSIGHRDDENVVRDNDILRSGKCGLLFRPERGEGFTARGNRIENNRIVDSGGEDGAAVDIQGVTAGNTLEKNTIRETRGPAARIGIRIGAEAGENALTENVIEGFSVPVQDLRKS
jgi:hypothetical protein